MIRSPAGRLVSVVLWSATVVILLAMRSAMSISDAVVTTIVGLVIGYALLRLFWIWLK